MADLINNLNDQAAVVKVAKKRKWKKKLPIQNADITDSIFDDDLWQSNARHKEAEAKQAKAALYEQQKHEKFALLSARRAEYDWAKKTDKLLIEDEHRQQAAALNEQRSKRERVRVFACLLAENAQVLHQRLCVHQCIVDQAQRLYALYLSAVNVAFVDDELTHLNSKLAGTVF